MWFTYSYFITIILLLMLVIFEMGLKPTTNAKLKDFAGLFFFFIPLINYVFLVGLTMMVLLDIKDYCYKKFIDQVKKSLEAKE